MNIAVHVNSLRMLYVHTTDSYCCMCTQQTDKAVCAQNRHTFTTGNRLLVLFEIDP
jgi:hypothetical protein